MSSPQKHPVLSIKNWGTNKSNDFPPVKISWARLPCAWFEINRIAFIQSCDPRLQSHFILLNVNVIGNKEPGASLAFLQMTVDSNSYTDTKILDWLVCSAEMPANDMIHDSSWPSVIHDKPRDELHWTVRFSIPFSEVCQLHVFDPSTVSTHHLGMLRWGLGAKRTRRIPLQIEIVGTSNCSRCLGLKQGEFQSLGSSLRWDNPMISPVGGVLSSPSRDLMGLQLWDGLVTFGDTRPCCVLAFFQTLPEEEEVLPGSCIPYTHSLIREIGWETSTSYIALYTLHDFAITTMSLESTWININLQKFGSEMWWCSLCFSNLNFWGSDFYEAQNGKVEARLKTEGSFHAMTWVLFGLFKIHGLKLQYDPMILDYTENWCVSKWQALLWFPSSICHVQGIFLVRFPWFRDNFPFRRMWWALVPCRLAYMGVQLTCRRNQMSGFSSKSSLRWRIGDRKLRWKMYMFDYSVVELVEDFWRGLQICLYGEKAS